MRFFLSIAIMLLTGSFAMASSNYSFMGESKHIPICSSLPYEAVVNSNMEYSTYEDERVCGVINTIFAKENLRIGFYGSIIYINKGNISDYHDFRLFLKEKIFEFNFPYLTTDILKVEKIDDSIYDTERIYLNSKSTSEQNELVYESAIRNDKSHLIIIFYIVLRQLTPEIYTKLDDAEDIATFTELWTDLMTWYSDSKTLLAPTSKN